MDQNKFVSGQLNQIFCFQIQEHFKDAFCHPYYFVSIQMRYKCRAQIINCINTQTTLHWLHLWNECVDYDYEEHVLKLEK